MPAKHHQNSSNPPSKRGDGGIGSIGGMPEDRKDVGEDAEHVKDPAKKQLSGVQRDHNTDVCILWRILANLRSGDKVSVRNGGDLLCIQPPSFLTPFSRSWRGDKRDAIPEFVHPVLSRKTIESLQGGKQRVRDELKIIIPDGLRALQSLKDTYNSDLLFCARLNHSLYLLKKDMADEGLVASA